MKKKMKKSIVQMGVIYVALFAIVISYLSYFVIVKSKNIVIHTHNRRMDPIENEVVRGDILSGDGQIIATTITSEEQSSRQYPQGRTYAHAVGYTQKGKTGIEALANVELLRPHYTLESIFRRTFEGDKFKGRDVVLTLDSQLQKAAENALGNQRGAVVMIESSTGKIKALVSKPDFDPNTVSDNWDQLIVDEVNTPLVNRALSGLYPPGSIFKIVTAQAFLNIKGSRAELAYTCKGHVTIDDHTIHCFNQNVHGEEDLADAFRDSCNTYFINMGQQVGADKLQQVGEQLLFNKKLPISLEHSKSQLLLNQEAPEVELGATYIGQGKTLVTPIHMAMLAASIGNEGILMKPYIIDYSKDKKGRVKTKNLPQYMAQMMPPEDAQRLEKMMVQVVESGTGQRARVSGMYSGGKTGTAQNETSRDHSWFIGFAGNDIPEISMAIIIENAGKDASASTIAHKVIEQYKNLQ